MPNWKGVAVLPPLRGIFYITKQKQMLKTHIIVQYVYPFTK